MQNGVAIRPRVVRSPANPGPPGDATALRLIRRFNASYSYSPSVQFVEDTSRSAFTGRFHASQVYTCDETVWPPCRRHAAILL